jgi:hypothetical protein
MPSNTAGTVEGSPYDWSFKTVNLQEARDHCKKDGFFFFIFVIYMHIQQLRMIRWTKNVAFTTAHNI